MEWIVSNCVDSVGSGSASTGGVGITLPSRTTFSGMVATESASSDVHASTVETPSAVNSSTRSPAVENSDVAP